MMRWLFVRMKVGFHTIQSAHPILRNSTFSFELKVAADLWPYFHDNSAETLEDVMEVYRTVFLVTAFGTGNNAWMLSPQEEMDIVNYMEFAFRHQPVLLP